MIRFRQGDLFLSEASVLVNPVNCVGVMGKGLALQFKRRYHGMFEDYREACRKGKLRPGLLHVWQGPNITVVNFPTKDYWRDPSRYEHIESGLDALAALLGPRKLTVAMPALGCGLGGLKWSRVAPIACEYLGDCESIFEVFVYEAMWEREDETGDGLGSVWSTWCERCGGKTVQVVRPGKAQCWYCG